MDKTAAAPAKRKYTKRKKAIMDELQEQKLPQETTEEKKEQLEPEKQPTSQEKREPQVETDDKEIDITMENQPPNTKQSEPSPATEPVTEPVHVEEERPSKRVRVTAEPVQEGDVDEQPSFFRGGFVKPVLLGLLASASFYVNNMYKTTQKATQKPAPSKQKKRTVNSLQSDMQVPVFQNRSQRKSVVPGFMMWFFFCDVLLIKRTMPPSLSELVGGLKTQSDLLSQNR